MNAFRTLLLCLCASVPSVPAVAQCPDGTLPPCVSRAARAQPRAAPPPAAERGRRFLILPFRNLSRSPQLEWLVEGSTTMLADALGRWQEISVVTDDRLYPALQRNGLAPGAVMDQPRVRRVAEETGGWTAVTGEVLETGGRLRVSARAYDVVTSRELVRATDDVPAGDDVRPAFERIGTRLLRTAGLDTASVDLGATTTRSLDAYRAYLRGVALANRARYRSARDAFLEAVRLDSGFAQAYRSLAVAEIFIDPLAIFEGSGPALRHAARAAELAGRLPPAQRDLVLALNDVVQGQFTSARAALERRVAADSNDLDAIALLSLVAFSDPILVPVPGGERPRGSLNRSGQLARHILRLNSENHSAYLTLIAGCLTAGGDLPGLVVGVRREGATWTATFFQGQPRLFVPLLRDSFELVPVESLGTIPRDTLAAARRRALEAARAWAERWLSVGPGEGEAHLAAAKVRELQGDLAGALAELRVADSLGVEPMGIVHGGFLRLAVLGKLGRYGEAHRLAETLWARGAFDAVFPMATGQTESLAWEFNLALMFGDDARAEAALTRLAAGMRRLGIVPDSSFAAAAALPLVAGAAAPPLWQLELPAPFRADVMDSVWARRAAIPPSGWLAGGIPPLPLPPLLLGQLALPAPFRADVMDSVWARRAAIPPGGWLQGVLPTLARLASSAAAADSTLAARVRTAPWFQPPR